LFTGEQIFSFFLHQPPPLQFVNNLFYFSPFNLPFYSNAHDVILFYFYFSDFLIQLSSPLEWVHNFFGVLQPLFPLGFTSFSFATDGLCSFVPPPPSKFFLLCNGNGNGLFFFFFFLPSTSFSIGSSNW